MDGGIETSAKSFTSDSRMPRRHIACHCNMETPLVTSWTEENARRRFYGCGLFKETGRRGCNFFEWHDPPLNVHEKRIIIALLRNVDELKVKENELKTNLSEMKKREKFLGICLLFSWVIVFLMLLVIIDTLIPTLSAFTRITHAFKD
ncbi:cyanogenic beta-glucosidase [Spatholobus suberectus]|nr:cyanogenic beta-glucosidase [Spatholobus suberectus]